MKNYIISYDKKACRVSLHSEISYPSSSGWAEALVKQGMCTGKLLLKFPPDQTCGFQNV